MPIFYCSPRYFFHLTALSILTGLLFLVGTVTPSQAAYAKPSNQLVNINADHQTFDPDKGKSILKGNVSVSYDNVSIYSKEATLDMSQDGLPSVANFFPRPTAKRWAVLENNQRKEDKMAADLIQLVIDQSIMRASGNVETYVATVAADPFTIRSDVQQFDNKSKVMLAQGRVSVKKKDLTIDSSKAKLDIAANGQAEKVTFLGGTRLVQEGSIITSDKMTILIASGNMVAEGNVLSTVDNKSGGSGKVIIKASTQSYDKNSGNVIASGNVRLLYEDYDAVGPKATFKMNNGSLDRIIMTGRPTITDKDRKITADIVTISVNPKKFDAVGNVKTQLKTEQMSSQPAAAPAKPTASGKKPAPSKPIKGGPELLKESDFADED